MVEEDLEYITFDGDVLTKSDFRDEIINKYISAHLDGLTKITDFTIGSEAYHLADIMATYILEHRELVDLNYKMSMIHSAEGEFLDNFGDMVGVHRYASSPSRGFVTFTRLSSRLDSNINIPDGTQISTDDAISFIVDNGGEDIILYSGATSVSAPVICEQYGSYTNVNPNTITLVMGQLGSLVSVNNEEPMVDGQDIEDDDDYRSRILLSPYQAPTGTLAWYENVSLSVDTVHDVRVEKGETLVDSDIYLIFNPKDWTDTVIRQDINRYNQDNDYENTSTGEMTRARADLVDLFNMNEFNIVGITMSFLLAEKVLMLEGDLGVEYLFGVLLESGYSLDMVKSDIINAINKFNEDALIGIEFNPSSLASIIENEITGVSVCKIVKYEDNNYTEILEPENVGLHEIYSVDIENIENRIRLINFNLDLGDIGD